MTGLTEMVCKPQQDIYNPKLGINKPISYLQGLTVRKVANIIHNSLMLVENPEEINYNTAARLYRLLTKEFTFEQRIKLDFLLRDVYASEDDELGKRLTELSCFKRTSTDAINTEEDLAADVMANIMYNTAKANATFDVTRKSGSLNIESLVGSYFTMLPELTQKGINIDNALNSGLKGIDAQLGMYNKQVTQFIGSYVELRKEHDRSAIKLAIKDGNGETRIEEGADKFIRQHQEDSREVFVDENHEVVAKDDMKGKPVFNVANKDISQLLDELEVLNG
jgi:hypothetical protein